ncbi:MAG: hypothetical protein IJ410_08915 [Oscillospiraceae bacterium]|nr:hypothetical protein [Oscillospiraceae bacterium]
MSTTALKIIALILMTIDHIGRFIPGMPLLTRIIGRASRPLFAFCAVQGFEHTSDRDNYLKRMYIFSVITGVMNFALNSIYPDAYHTLSGNIFSSLFIAFFIINTGFYGANLARLAYVLIFNTVVHNFVAGNFSANLLNITDAIFPEIFHCEGSILFFALVAALYRGRESKKETAEAFGCYCLVYLVLVLLANTPVYTSSPLPLMQLLFSYSIQWLQILALPLMLLYNGKKGPGLKYFFYIYYPLHSAVLFVLGNTF